MGKGSKSEVHAYAHILHELIVKKGWNKNQIYTQQECKKVKPISEQLGLKNPENIVKVAEKIFYVIEGSGVLTVGKDEQKNLPVGPGDIIRIPVEEWHSIRADSGTILKYLAIDCFGSIRNENEPTWDSHVKVLCKEQGWDYNTVKK